MAIGPQMLRRTIRFMNKFSRWQINLPWESLINFRTSSSSTCAATTMKEVEMNTKPGPTDESSARLSVWSLDQTRSPVLLTSIVMLAFISITLVYFSVRSNAQPDREQVKIPAPFDDEIASTAKEMFRRGREIFRYDSFGDEVYWTDKLK